MNRSFTAVAVCCGCSLLFAAPAWSQAPDWTTTGNDAQRSSWIRADLKISTESVSDPGFKLMWKIELDNQARHGNALTPPVLLDFLISHRGFRSLAFVGGSSDRVFVMDTDLARMEWERRLSAGDSSNGTPDCPGGMTTGLTRLTNLGLPPLGGIVARGRRTPAESGVGQPNEGAVTLAAAASRSPSRPAAPPVSSRERPPARRVLRGLNFVYALTSDGMLRTLYVSNGIDREPPIQFLPPNANAHGLIVVDGSAYVATKNGCGGVNDGVWALDLESKEVVSWKSPTGGIAGLAGPAFSPDGNLYAATSGGSVVALKAKTLELSDSYAPPGQGFTSSPVVIDYDEKDYLAVAAKDGSIHLLDGSSLSGSGHHTPPNAAASNFTPGALATWQDESGVDWVLAPSGPQASGASFPITNGAVTNGAVVAWKIVETGGSPALEPGWVSRNLISPLPPIVINGVVFAASAGAEGSSSAALYALDGATGKVLWESGDAIQTYAPRNGLSAGPGAVYMSTIDGTLHAFGFAIEH